MDIDGAEGGGGSAQQGPGIVTEAANEESVSLLFAVLEKGRTKTEVLLERVPRFQLRSKGGFGQVGTDVVVDDPQNVERGAAAAAEEVRGDAKEASEGRIHGAINSRE